MNDYSWFRLLIRAVGLVLLGIALPSFLGTVGNMASYFASAPTSSQFPFVLGWAAYATGSLFQLVLGIYLLRGGGKLTAHCLSSVLGRCMACGYDVRTIASQNCPECGAVLPGRSPTPEVKQSQSSDG